LSLALALVVGLLTHMVVAALAAAVIPYLVPALRLKNPQAGAMARLEALVCWTEALRDALRTSGLEDALRRVSQTASAAIGREMRHLVHNLDPKVGMSTGNALRVLADDLDDPSADAIIAPLVLAVEQQAKGLVDLLSALARAGRGELTMRGRIEAQRSPMYLQVRIVVWFSLCLFAALMLVARGYMSPFTTAFGEVVLALAIGAYASGLYIMLRLIRERPEPRLLHKENS
jgi:Flp pilus assembly protein TadB